MVKKVKVIVSFLLDETGSMYPYKNETIISFNKWLEEMKGNKGKALFTLTKFNSSKVDVVYNSAKLKDVKELTNETYDPSLATPLFDAIGKTVSAIVEDDSKNEHVLFVIMTDGEENASKEFSIDAIKKLIADKEKDGWTFIYLGANQDAWGVGKSFGIADGNIAAYATTKMGETMKGVSKSSAHYVARGGVQTQTLFHDAGVDTEEFDE